MVMNGATETKRGVELLHDPVLNKSSAFTEAEKQALGRHRQVNEFGVGTRLRGRDADCR